MLTHGAIVCKDLEMKTFWLVISCLLWASVSLAQGYLTPTGGVQQQGNIIPGNATKWNGNNLVADGGSLDQMTFVQPASGFSNTIPDNTRFYIFGAPGLLAAGTLTMPPNPIDGQRVTVSSRSAITLFTLNANTGQTLYGGLTTLGLAGFGTWIYRASDTSWYRIG